jgi:hypothetical protein
VQATLALLDVHTDWQTQEADALAWIAGNADRQLRFLYAMALDAGLSTVETAYELEDDDPGKVPGRLFLRHLIMAGYELDQIEMEILGDVDGDASEPATPAAPDRRRRK